MTKLTETDKVDIRHMYHSENKKMTDIAELYNVDVSRISRAINYNKNAKRKKTQTHKAEIVEAQTRPIKKRAERDTKSILNDLYAIRGHQLSLITECREANKIEIVRRLLLDLQTTIGNEYKLKQELITLEPPARTEEEIMNEMWGVLKPLICKDCKKKIMDVKE